MQTYSLHSKKMVGLFAVLVGLATFSHIAFGDEHMVKRDSVSVVGNGEVSAEPDQALISISVSALNKDVNQAKASADRKYSSVLASIKQQKIADKDIKVTSINLSPEYEWTKNEQVLKGTRVSRSLVVTVNNLERVAPLLQGLVEGGVSRIDSVNTGFKDRSGLERKALTAAIEDAKEKANFLATQFGKKLGSAHQITEHSQSQPTHRPFNEGMMQSKVAAAPSLPSEMFGTQSVRASVSVIFHTE